jgi:hypothetical protein
VVASLVFAIVFSPVLMLASGALGYESLSITLALSAMGLAVAWVSWNRYSRLTIPSIETRVPARAVLRPRS